MVDLENRGDQTTNLLPTVLIPCRVWIPGPPNF